MADTVLLANYQDFLTELMESQQLVFGYETPTLAELSGLERNGDYVVTRDPNQSVATAKNPASARFSGKQVTVPLQLGDVSSAGVAEGGTFIQPAPFSTDQAVYNLKSRNTVIGLSLELERDAKNGSTAAMDAVEAYTQSAYRAHARTDNDYLHGNGTGLLCNVASNTGSGTLVVDVGTGTGVNWDQLTPGRVVSILTRSSGADPGNGKRRKIASVVRSTGLITFDTAAVASDGGSGNITFSSSEGIYIDNSYAANCNGINPSGLGNVVSTTDTLYGTIDKTAVSQWQGIQVPAGTTILSDDWLDTAVYYLRGNGVGAPDFAVAHPLTVDPYKATKTSLVRIEMQDTMLKSGFKGIIYQGGDKEFPILKDLASPRATCRLITKSSMKIYGDGTAPTFIDDDGSMWRFAARNSKKEAWLFHRWQLGARDCGKNAAITGLSE